MPPYNGRMSMKTTLAALSLITLTATAAMATPWTDEQGNPNPACLSQHCHDTGVPDAPPVVDHSDPTPLHGDFTPHNGFSCAHSGHWVYHPAARPVMTPAHDAAAKVEALDRLARLGDKAADMKCRPWQIAAGFKIAGVM
jgi:hypothetical protein